MATETLTAQELTDLRLGTLNTAVSDWKTMADRLELLATGGNGEASATDLEKKANAANWKGANATVSREFVTKTAAQFADAADEAKSVLAVLRDAHTALKKHKESLRTAIDELAKSNIYVNGNGKVAASVPSGQAAGDADIHKPTDGELDAAQSRITRILWEATETDRIAARALRQLARNKYDFTDQGPDNLKDADRDQGKADAEYWRKEVAKGDVSEWSEEKLARFNETLENQRDNPGFTESFATGLGADGTLQFWRDLAAPPGGAVEGDRAKMLGHVQDNLSMALANASHSDSQAMETWKKDVIASGTKIFPVDPAMPMGPNGYQVMSSLMGKGKYDDDFLHDYGDAMLKYEREYPGDPGVAWRDTTDLSYPPTGNANDPVAGYMEALGHNPEASLEFFNDSTTADGKKLDNWDYLVGHGNDARKWPLGDDGKPTGFDNLGHALESATLGYAYDDQDPSIPPMKTEAQIEARNDRLDLVSKVVDNYESAEVIDNQPGIRDSIANIAAGHIDSLNYSMADWGGSGDLADRDGMFNDDQRHLRDLGEPNTANFLRALGSDKDSYDTVSVAQQTYGSSLMAAQGDHQSNALDAGLHSVTMHGLLDQARAESIGEQFADDEKERNKALEKQGEWRNFAAGATVGVAVGVASGVVVPVGAAAAIAVPLAFETAGSAAETHMATETIDWLDENEYKNDQQAVEGIQKAKQDGQHNAMTPLLNYAEQHDMSASEVRKLARDARGVYNDGGEYTDTDDTRGW
ncbi:hypothetical protein ABZ027_27105 [Streptomyces sp. NPDC006332]|uniref:hypothetical protein n=1 Tax=Streptomyces sp. NPDC006332 TaxID=3155456 RepID=UPI0033AB0777